MTNEDTNNFDANDSEICEWNPTDREKALIRDTWSDDFEFLYSLGTQIYSYVFASNLLFKLMALNFRPRAENFGPALVLVRFPFCKRIFYTEFFKECTSNFKTVKQAKILGIGRYRYFDSFYSVISKIFRYSSIWQGINIVSNIEKSLENTPSLAGYHYKTAFLL